MTDSDLPLRWDHVSAAVERLFGLHLQGARLPALKRGLQGAANELGYPSIEAGARLLLSGNLDAASKEVVASHLTIGETYFFRDARMFAALSARILPELIATRRREKNLRLGIWSAGCCTGEEIYSLATLLRPLLPDIGDWKITLLGTDINPGFLHKAADATYDQWSFRGTSADFQNRHFRAKGDRYVVLPAIRSMVSFAQLNLVDEAAIVRMGDGAFDLILCRNVLMYFTSAQASRVAGALHGALHEDGWLAVAPCEASQTLFARFRHVHCDEAVFYRKCRPPDSRPAAKGASNVPAVPGLQGAARPPGCTGGGLPPRIRRPIALRARKRGAALPAEVAATRARILADQRHMGEALTWCDRWIAAEKLDPAAHYLRGMILAETGDLPGACAALERSLYLAPNGMMASLVLGNLERARGRESQAKRHYRNILATLGQLPSEAGIEHAEGVTVRQLAGLVKDLVVGARG